MPGRFRSHPAGRGAATVGGVLGGVVLAPILLGGQAQASPLPVPDPIAGLLAGLPAPVVSAIPILAVTAPPLTSATPSPTATTSPTATPAPIISPILGALAPVLSQLTGVGVSPSPSVTPSTNPSGRATPSATTTPATPTRSAAAPASATAVIASPRVEAVEHSRSTTLSGGLAHHASVKPAPTASPTTVAEAAAVSVAAATTAPTLGSPVAAVVSNVLFDPSAVSASPPVNQAAAPLAKAFAASGQTTPVAPRTIGGRAAADVRSVTGDPAALGVGITALGIAAVGLAAAGQLVVRARRI